MFRVSHHLYGSRLPRSSAHNAQMLMQHILPTGPQCLTSSARVHTNQAPPRPRVRVLPGDVCCHQRQTWKAHNWSHGPSVFGANYTLGSSYSSYTEDAELANSQCGHVPKVTCVVIEGSVRGPSVSLHLELLVYLVYKKRGACELLDAEVS